jgi:hypothetical protein
MLHRILEYNDNRAGKAEDNRNSVSGDQDSSSMYLILGNNGARRQ